MVFFACTGVCPANPVRTDLEEAVRLDPSPAPWSFFALPIDLGATLKVGDENSPRDREKKGVSTAHLSVVQEQVRPWFSADQHERAVEREGGGSGRKQSGVRALEGKRGIEPTGFAEKFQRWLMWIHGRVRSPR